MKKSEVIQYYAAFVIATGNTIASFMIVWPSYTIPLLKSDSSILNMHISETHGSLIGSLPMLGSLLSTLTTKLTMDGLGRRRSNIIASLLNVLSWSLIATTNSLTLLLIARFMLGIAGGLTMTAACVMSGEFASDQIRGKLLAFPVFGYNTGYLISYLMGWFCSYQVVSYVMVVVCLGFCMMTCTLKETPAFLLKRGQEKEALQSLMFYRFASVKTQEILVEFDIIKNSLEREAVEMKVVDGKFKEDDEKLQSFLEIKGVKAPPQSSWKYLVYNKSCLRGLIICTVLFMFLVFMGSLAIQTYAGDFFMKSAPNLSSDFCSVILAVANMVGSGLSIVLIDTLGRRILQITSCFINCLALLMVWSILKWQWAPAWTIPASMLVSCAALQLGAGSVPPVLMGEVLLPDVKALGTTLVLSVMIGSNFILLAGFSSVVDTFGLDGTFFAFGCVAALGALFSYVFTPETKGLSANKVQELLSRGWIQYK